MRAALVMCALGMLLATAAQAQAIAGFKPQGQSRHLAVLLHAFESTGQDMASVAAAMSQSPEGAHTDLFMPDLPFGMFSQARPAEVVAGLVQQMDALWAARKARGEPYQSVLLIGHSMGSLYSRKLYVTGMGERGAAPLERELKDQLKALGVASAEAPREWALATQRIVLLAGINRGWSISHHMSLVRGLEMSAGLWWARLSRALGMQPYLIMAAHRGAPFITQLRLQWLALQQSETTRPLAQVVQLLGTEDDLVPPSDNIDTATGTAFIYLEVPRSGHANVVKMDEHTAEGAGRARVLREALAMPRNASTLRPQALADAPTPDQSVQDVVFVMHGIRDEGYWTEKIGSRVLRAAEAANPPRKVALEVSSYGYFPMLSFLRPGARQEKVEWLMDRYTHAKARYPNARISYIGHSHGTYLMLKALEDYPAVRFHRVVFAGSVVRSDEDWAAHLGTRVGGVLNFAASADWVVAFFPNALQQLNLQDLGGAGHRGFESTAPGLVQVANGQYARGAHSAALAEDWWNAIAGYVLHGEFKLPPNAPVETAQSPWVAWPAKAAPAIWLVGLLLLLWGLVKLWRSQMREWMKTVAVLAYLGLIWVVVTQA